MACQIMFEFTEQFDSRHGSQDKLHKHFGKAAEDDLLRDAPPKPNAEITAYQRSTYLASASACQQSRRSCPNIG